MEDKTTERNLLGGISRAVSVFLRELASPTDQPVSADYMTIIHLSVWSESSCDVAARLNIQLWELEPLCLIHVLMKKFHKRCQSCSNAEMAGIRRCLTGINWIRALCICELTGIFPTGLWVRNRGVALNVLKLSESVFHFKISNTGCI